MSEMVSANELPNGAYLTKTRNPAGGNQVCVNFRNGWKLSIVNHAFSYGVEGAIFNPSGEIDYDNPVMGSDGVEGWLTPARIRELISEIDAL